MDGPRATVPGEPLGSLIGRNARALAASQASGKVAGFAAMVVLARFLGRVDFGRYTVAVALVSLLAVVAESGTSTYQVREGSQRPHDLGRILGHVLLIRGVLGLASIAVTVPIGLALDYDSTTFAAVVIFAAASAIRLLAGPFLTTLQVLERMGDMARVQAEQSVVQAAVMGAVAVATRDVIAISWAVLGLSVLYPAWALHNLRRRWHGAIALHTDGFFTTVRTTVAFAVSAAMFMLLAYLDSVMVQAFDGNAAAGLYGAAYRILIALSIIPAVYTQAVTRSMTHLAVVDRDRMSDLYSRTVGHLVTFGFPLAAGGAILSRPLITLMFGDRYAGAGTALAILLATLVLVFPGYVNVTAAYALGLERTLAAVMVVVVAANAGANLVAIPALGIKGAALATLGAECLFLILIGPRLLSAGLRPRLLSAIAKATLATVAMAVVVWPLRDLPLAVPVVTGAVIYAGLLVALRAFSPEDRVILSGFVGRKRPEAASVSLPLGDGEATVP